MEDEWSWGEAKNRGLLGVYTEVAGLCSNSYTGDKSEMHLGNGTGRI